MVWSYHHPVNKVHDNRLLSIVCQKREKNLWPNLWFAKHFAENSSCSTLLLVDLMTLTTALSKPVRQVLANWSSMWPLVWASCKAKVRAFPRGVSFRKSFHMSDGYSQMLGAILDIFQASKGPSFFYFAYRCVLKKKIDCCLLSTCVP